MVSINRNVVSINRNVNPYIIVRQILPTMEKIMTKDSRMVATTMVFVPALIASVTEVAEIEVRLNANVKMKNFEASFWKPVNRRTKTQHYVCTYVHDKYKFMHGGVFA